MRVTRTMMVEMSAMMWNALLIVGDDMFDR